MTIKDDGPEVSVGLPSRLVPWCPAAEVSATSLAHVKKMATLPLWLTDLQQGYEAVTAKTSQLEGLAFGSMAVYVSTQFRNDLPL